MVFSSIATAAAYGIVALLAVVAAVFGIRTINRIRNDRRQTKALKGGCEALTELACSIAEAEIDIKSPDAHPDCRKALETAKATFAKLKERRELFYEEGGTPSEWAKIQSKADTTRADLLAAWNKARQEKQWAGLARSSTEAAELKLANFNAGEGKAEVDTSLVQDNLDRARDLFQQRRFTEAWERTQETERLIEFCGEAHSVKSLLVQLRPGDSTEGHGKTKTLLKHEPVDLVGRAQAQLEKARRLAAEEGMAEQARTSLRVARILVEQAKEGKSESDVD